jgi:hypothetical protein
MEELKSLTKASAIARQRLNDYLDEKLKDEWDESKWEFFTYLLEQAKWHRISHSGYVSFEQKQDQEEAVQNYHACYGA